MIQRSLLHLAALLLAVASLLLAAASGRAQDESAASQPTHTYDLVYDVRVSPSERSAAVRIELGRGAQHVRWLRLSLDLERHVELAADGELELEDEHAIWKPPAAGGALRYRFRVDHLRNERSYDARLASRWALFRGDHLIPPIRSLTSSGAHSRARLHLRLPEGWSAALPYPRIRGGDYRIEQPGRRLDRPAGWILLGEIGVVREDLGDTHIAIAGPVRHGVRRLDMLALLRWCWPTLSSLSLDLPERVLIVSAGDPMWRGGLSGPGSLYLHATRPLVDEDGTSPLLHELLHTLTGARAGDSDDAWIEGLAEFYAYELLRRSGTLSEERSASVWDHVERRANGGSPGAQGMLALRDLDSKIRERSAGEHSLDDVLRLASTQRDDSQRDPFRTLVQKATELDPTADLGLPPPPPEARVGDEAEP